MRKSLTLIVTVAFVALVCGGQSKKGHNYQARGDSPISSTPGLAGSWIPGSGQHGWFQIPNTRMDTVCPPDDYNGTTYAWSANCKNVMYAWSGGVEDTSRHRMLIWGGGHNDYPGNEIYSLNLYLNPVTVARITDPTTATQSGAKGPANLGGPCVAMMSDGTANNAHTYNAMVYDQTKDRILVLPDGVTCRNGDTVPRIVSYSVADSSWVLKSNGALESDYNDIVAVDSSTNHYWINTFHHFYDYDPARDQLTSKLDISTDTHIGGAYDATRKLFAVLGPNTFYSINTRTFVKTNLTMPSSCSAIASPTYPSVVWDSDRDLLVIYNNAGDTVYEYNLGSNTCAARTTNPNPCGSPGTETRGTFGRWQYEAAYKVFALWNDPHQNACVWWP
jgi:hypothetical protein